MSFNPDIHELSVGDAGYPQALIERLGPRAPKRLFCMGNLELLEKKSVGFCGSRKASEKGLQTAEDCSAQAALSNVVVISGNAAGVDLHAHREALKCGGETILVLPEGIKSFGIRKPFREYWDWSRVLVISQFEPDTPWRAYNAMARNKVILGLSCAMVVIEAGERGGTLNAGKSTLDANLPLFVAQYEIAEESARGNEILIKLGGIPLNRLKSTNRANMSKVWDSFKDPNCARLQPKLL